MRKIIFLTALVFPVLFLLPRPAAGGMDDALRIVVNDDFLAADVPPLIVSGHTLVPARPLAEKLGATVQWEAASQTITIKKGDDTVRLTIGRLVATHNGISRQLPVAPKLVRGRAMVPLRFTATALGQQVRFNYWHTTPMIWVTSSPLLGEKDTAVTPDFIEVDAGEGPPYYQLKHEGQTARGIKLGDSATRVKELYGPPFREETVREGQVLLIYFGEYLPHSGAVRSLTFTCRDGRVVAVTIQH
ncbi:MAG: iron complex transport system substrate-binding protein [Clostridia bacterium]|nr:iron complex transport system substrate-binding protein [Clostridia bacterium]